MNMKTLRKKLKGFTLVEILITMGVILFIMGFFLSGGAKMIKQSEEAKAQYLLTKMADGIRSFKADWAELPPTLSYIVDQKILRDYAKSKKIALSSPKPYIEDTVTTTAGIGQIWACPKWDPTDPSNPHAHHVGNPWYAVGVLKKCRQAYGGYKNCHTKVALCEVAGVGESVPADLWGNMIYYTKSSDGSTFKLVSPGPDGKIGTVNGTISEWKAATANYVGTSSEDKDNIVFEGKA